MTEEKLFQQAHASHDQSHPPGYDCPECRSIAIRVIMRRLDDGDNKFDELTRAMRENTRITQENSDTLRDVKEIVVMGRSLFKMAGWIGSGIKWTAGILLACTGGWAVIEKWFK